MLVYFKNIKNKFKTKQNKILKKKTVLLREFITLVLSTRYARRQLAPDFKRCCS